VKKRRGRVVQQIFFDLLENNERGGRGDAVKDLLKTKGGVYRILIKDQSKTNFRVVGGKSRLEKRGKSRFTLLYRQVVNTSKGL